MYYSARTGERSEVCDIWRRCLAFVDRLLEVSSKKNKNRGGRREKENHREKINLKLCSQYTCASLHFTSLLFSWLFAGIHQYTTASRSLLYFHLSIRFEKRTLVSENLRRVLCVLLVSSSGNLSISFIFLLSDLLRKSHAFRWVWYICPLSPRRSCSRPRWPWRRASTSPSLISLRIFLETRCVFLKSPAS